MFDEPTAIAQDTLATDAAAPAATAGDVLVIEAGGLYTEKTFPTRERDAYQQLYLDSGFTATADAHIAILAGGSPKLHDSVSPLRSSRRIPGKLLPECG